MNSVQKSIKYVAIVFAALLAVGIIGSIVGAAASLFNAVGGGVSGSGNIINFTETYSDIREIELDGSYYRVQVKTDSSLNGSNTVRVDMQNVYDDYSARVRGDKLEIGGETEFFNFNLFGFNRVESEKGNVILYLPEDYRNDRFVIDGGMGDMTLDYLNTEELTIDAGMGEIYGSDITSDSTEMNIGMGNVTLSQANIGKSDIDGGMGNVTINGSMEGDIELNCGMGNIELNLSGNMEDYKIKSDNGMGKVRVNGHKLSDETWNESNARYTIKIDGGMGNVDLTIQ